MAVSGVEGPADDGWAKSKEPRAASADGADVEVLALYGRTTTAPPLRVVVVVVVEFGRTMMRQ